MRGGGRVTLEVGELLPSARSIGQSWLLQLSLPRKTNTRQTSQHGKQILTFPKSEIFLVQVDEIPIWNSSSTMSYDPRDLHCLLQSNFNYIEGTMTLATNSGHQRQAG